MNYKYLTLSIILCLAVGFTSGLLTDTNSTWFLDLNKPVIYPPGYLFGVVWTLLYILMGISLYLILEKTKEKLPYILFSAQLILNFFWTLIFFGLENIPLAIIEILLLLGLLVWTYVVFKKYSKLASYLLIPYIVWVSFATILTINIAILN